MSKRVTVFFANGFEEIEGLTVVDLLRRAKCYQVECQEQEIYKNANR